MTKQLKLVYLLCPACGKLVSKPLAWVKKAKRPTCSRKCNGVLRGQEWGKHGHKGRAAWSEETNQKFRDRMAGASNPNWKGGRTTSGPGYIMLRMPKHPRAGAKGYVYEHIVVMEATLGRPLRPGEVVHHIDGNPANNSPDNLKLHKSQRHHLRIEHPDHFANAVKNR